MLIVFILLLTILSIALRLASVSVIAANKIAARSESIKIKEGTLDPKDQSKVGKKAKGMLYRSATKTLFMAKMIVDFIRNILAAILPIILVVDVVIFILLVVISSGYLALFN